MIQIPNWNKILIAVICALGLIYAAPNFFEEDAFEGMPSWLPGKQINLGLDLRGGVHLLMNVEIEKVVSKRLDSMRDATRQNLRPLRRSGVYYSSLKIEGNSVVLKLKDPAHIGQIGDLLESEFQATSLSPLGTPEQEVEITNDDTGTFRLTLTEEAIRRISSSAVNQSIEIIRRRIDEDGTKEPIIQQQGSNRILLQVPGAEDPEEIKKILGKTAQMTFHLVDQSTDANRGSSMLLPSDEIGSDGKPIQMRVERQVRVSGEHLVDSQPSFDQSNRPAVSFRFDAVGGRKFGDTTSKNVGRLLAIVLDNKIISAPRIQSAIVGGSGIITGSFSVKETNDLALLLRAGALPAPLTF
ncbi:MAG: protein translocase subunit SecD, partial [Rhodospirillaceae bacterium]|nr:protein translocase subunit SecD [Rhodospirillaceae bacterium]